MSDQNAWLQKYVESIDKRLERIEDNTNARLARLEEKVQVISEFKSQLMVGTALGSFVMGVVIQVAIAYFAK